MELDVRQKEDLIDAYRLTNEFVSRNYLDALSTVNIYDAIYNEEKTLSSIRITKVNKIAYDKDEYIIGKLINVYNALYDVQGGLALIINGTKEGIDFYLGARTLDDTSVVLLQKTLEKSIQGNFPGCEVKKLNGSDTSKLLNEITTSKLTNTPKIVSSVTGVATLKDDDKDTFIQGLEKFIDAMRGESYTAILLADAVPKTELAQIRAGYENIYTQMTPFATTELSFGANESTSITEGISKGFTETTSQNLTQTQTNTYGISRTHTTGISNSNTTNKGAILAVGPAAAGALMFGPAGALVAGTLGSVPGALIGSETMSYNQSNSYAANESKSYGDSESSGISKADSVQNSESKADTTGQSRTLQIKMENKTAQELLSKTERMLERIGEGENLGMWNSAAYFIAEDAQTARVASSTYAAIVRGQNTSVEGMHINIWDQDNRVNLERITNSLKSLKHPILNVKSNSNIRIPNITPGTLVTTQELSIQMAWPRKSIQGLPVIEYAEFSRDIVTYDGIDHKNSIRLGQVYHMGRPETTPINIDVESLSMHTFITGSTGAGKSNTIYYILNELKQKKQIPFLIIEPAKGEYKNIFGGYSDVTILGTNPYKSDILRINPFAFPKDIHVLEHIDRLTEIFNICWPMYAAMPAVLKDAIERAYKKCGWNLETSRNKIDEKLFPSFIDLLDALPEVIGESAYSEELKGNYIGSLVTRVKSLTNGLNGSIFTTDEVDSKILFDSSCIVDLSRVGNSETKALIMGILVMRLQEYRMSNAQGGNESLKHITVLEEAHNILKRTSTEQSSEGSNILGKAVEMLGNSIAEMRTYGEGFIIADQAPGLLDLAVIRNTNTKIILRLPEQGDRELVGRAAGLNDDQLKELVKLKRGVAAVYQNNWIQPVLCAIDKFEAFKPYLYTIKPLSESNDNVLNILVKDLLSHRIGQESNLDMERESLYKLMINAHISGSIKLIVLQKMKELNGGHHSLADGLTERDVNKIITKLVDGKSILKEAVDCENIDIWNAQIQRLIQELPIKDINLYHNEVLRALLQEYGNTDSEMKNFYKKWEENQNKQLL